MTADAPIHLEDPEPSYDQLQRKRARGMLIWTLGIIVFGFGLAAGIALVVRENGVLTNVQWCRVGRIGAAFSASIFGVLAHYYTFSAPHRSLRFAKVNHLLVGAAIILTIAAATMNAPAPTTP
ncbi:MAG: hypothetical protein AB7G17_01550 [Phycisphaerales bacterium]